MWQLGEGGDEGLFGIDRAQDPTAAPARHAGMPKPGLPSPPSKRSTMAAGCSGRTGSPRGWRRRACQIVFRVCTADMAVPPVVAIRPCYSASRCDCSCSSPSKISVSTVSKRQVGDRRELDRGAAAHDQRRLLAGALEQLAVHALDRAGDRVGAAAHQRVAGVGRELDRLAGRRLQAGRAHLERAQHQAEAGQDQAAEEAPGRRRARRP